MAVLWVVNAVGLVVVIPLVVFLATRIIRPGLVSARYADDILEHGVGITTNLVPVPALLETRELVDTARGRAVGYLQAIARLV
jgi:hypothetical protein